MFSAKMNGAKIDAVVQLNKHLTHGTPVGSRSPARGRSLERSRHSSLSSIEGIRLILTTTVSNSKLRILSNSNLRKI